LSEPKLAERLNRAGIKVASIVACSWSQRV